MTDNIYEDAARILMEGGHCKGLLQSDGRHCAMGALNLAGHGDAHYVVDACLTDFGPAWEAGSEAGNWLRDRGVDPYGGVDALVQWNNADETTGEDVILLFKELAAEHE